MNILLLSQFFSTTKGGGEYVFSMLAKMLVKNGHKVWIVTNEIKGESYDKNFNIIFVKPTLQYQGGLPPSFSDNIRYVVNAVIASSKVIQKNNIDIIHSNNFSPALAGSILSSLFSIPHVMTVHDIFSLCGKNYWEKWGDQANVSKLNVMLAPFFEKLMVKLKHECVHTVSDATKEDLLKFGEKRPIRVIHNSVDASLVLDAITNPLQFVHVGRLVFYKNLEVVIKAIGILKKTQPNVKLVIVGDGPHRKSLEELTNKLGLGSNVEFLGYASLDEKMKIIATSNALVFPSLCEGFGLVILEAFSQRKPVLVSNIKPMSDIISDEKNGFVLDPYDETAWAEHLLKLIKNPNQALKMGKEGSKLLVDSFNQDLMYDKIMEMYTCCTDKNKINS
ncbi:MAG: glycosyltransferase family 4 protein [Nitrosotalea sp.]